MALTIFLAILALAVTILAYIFIVPEKKRAGMNPLMQILHDGLNFKFLAIEKLMQALYIFLTMFVIFAGIFELFHFERGDWEGADGLWYLFLGPIVIRIAFELISMLIQLVKNVMQINNKLQNQNDDNKGATPFDFPDVNLPKVQFTPVQSAPPAPAPARLFCATCGAPTTNGHCPNGHC